MGMNKFERAEAKARKEKGKRKERRRLKHWHNLQSRSYTDASYWDDKAKSDDGVDHYRSKIDKNCGMFGEEYETGRSSFRDRRNDQSGDSIADG
jgi:hypothetical protein